MTIKITSLFATVTIAGILSMAPFMVNPNQAFAGGVVCNDIGSGTLADLLNSNNCIIVDDKEFSNFRNFNGNFDPSDILVSGVVVGDEKGLQFDAQILTRNIPNDPALNIPNIGISFDYDVISLGTPIIDNTLTFDFDIFDPSLTQSSFTRVSVSEQVHPDFAQQDPFIAFKEVFADGTGNFDDMEHRDFAPQQSISVNVDIGTAISPGFPSFQVEAMINSFTQTFSQESEEPPKELPVGGEFLPIDTTALLVAGAQTNALWILSTLAVIGSIAFGALYLTTRRA